MVLLITGVCRMGCFYCPLSEKKAGKDVIYANERKLTDVDEALEEADVMNAMGTGITGGDPLAVADRTRDAIESLKDRFGREHHVHLYTMTIPSEELLSELRRAGLDEIRFHVPVDHWSAEALRESGYHRVIGTARDLGLSTGIEVPAIPGMERQLEELCHSSMDSGAQFVNLNELELNYINCDALQERGYSTRSDVSSAVAGSHETGRSMVERFSEMGGATVHLCTVAFKDGVQLKNRIGRRAQRVMKGYHELTEDNTLIRALIFCPPTRESMEELRTRFEIDAEMIDVDEKNGCLTTAWYVGEEINPYITYKVAIIEEYPTHDALEVERHYLEK